MSKSKRTAYQVTSTPRVNEVTRFFEAPKHLCPRCKVNPVQGLVHCHTCTDELRSDKAATEMRFLARENPSRFRKVLAQILLSGKF